MISKETSSKNKSTLEPYSFRLADSKEIDKIISIWELNIKEEYNVDDKTIQEYARELAELFNNRKDFFNFWVAIDCKSHEIIGWQSFLPIFYTPLKKDTTVESSTYIHPKYHKKGVGYSLMQYAIDELSKYKVSFVYGFVNEDNEISIKLIRKIGFIEVGTLPALQTIFPFYKKKKLFIYTFL